MINSNLKLCRGISLGPVDRLTSTAEVKASIGLQSSTKTPLLPQLAVELEDLSTSSAEGDLVTSITSLPISNPIQSPVYPIER
jgi:hypothetical protein